MKIYTATGGYWNDGEVTVRWDGKAVAPLKPRLDLANHSPTGFAWGYGGSGPAQLALAILADCLGDDARALRLYQTFKRRIIQALDPMMGWTLREDYVLAWADAAEVLERQEHS